MTLFFGSIVFGSITDDPDTENMEVTPLAFVWLIIGTIIVSAWGIPDGSHWLVVSLVGASSGGVLAIAWIYMDQSRQHAEGSLAEPPKITPVALIAIGVFSAGLLSILFGPQTSQSFFSMVLAWVILLGLGAGMVFIGKRRSSSSAGARSRVR